MKTANTTINSSNQTKNLRYIDSIRGVAILMVIAVHSAQGFTALAGTIINKICAYGQMGVQLFFVASAYTLCLSFNNRNNESNFIKKYAIRRYFRIAPAYYLGIFIYFLVALLKYKLELGTTLNNYTIGGIIANVLFIHGFLTHGNNNIVPGGWSIGTEMLFYLIFPSLFYFTNKVVKSSITRGVLFLILTFAICQIFYVFLYQIKGEFVVNNNFWYYFILNQLPIFTLGIFYFHFQAHKWFQKSVYIDALFFGLLTIIANVLWAKFDEIHLFTLISFLSGLSFIFLIQIFKKCDKLNINLLVNIGKVSFSMYLIHFLFAFELKKIMLVKSTIEWNIWASVLGLIVIYILSVCASYKLAKISYHYIEQSCINLGKKIIKNMG